MGRVQLRSQASGIPETNPKTGTYAIDASGATADALTVARENEQDLAKAKPKLDDGWGFHTIVPIPPESVWQHIEKPLLYTTAPVLLGVIGITAGGAMGFKFGDKAGSAITFLGLALGVAAGVAAARALTNASATDRKNDLAEQKVDIENRHKAARQTVGDLDKTLKASLDATTVAGAPIWSNDVSGTVGGYVGQLIPIGKTSSTSHTTTTGSSSTQSTSRRQLNILGLTLSSPFSKKTSSSSSSVQNSSTNGQTVEFASSSEPFAIGRRLTAAGAHATQLSAALDPRAASAKGAVIVAENDGYSLYELDIQNSSSAGEFQQDDQIAISNPAIEGLVINGGIFGSSAIAQDVATGAQSRIFTFHGTTRADDRAQGLELGKLAATWSQSDISEVGVTNTQRQNQALSNSGLSMMELRTVDDAVQAAVSADGTQAVVQVGDAYRLFNVDVDSTKLIREFAVRGDSGARAAAIEVGDKVFKLPE